MDKLPKLLKRAYLGGIVEECMLNVNEENFAYIQAVDMANTVFIDVATDLTIPVLGKLGIGNLGLLCKYFDSIKTDPYHLSLDNNRLIIASEGHGKLNYLLTQPELIPTTVEDPDAMVRMKDACFHSVMLTEAQAKNLLMYLSTLKPSAVTLTASPSKVVVTGGLDSEHKFELSLGETEGEWGEEVGVPAEPYSISVYSDKMAAILNVLEWSDLEAPVLWFAPEHPLLIEQNTDNVWALVPVTVG